MTKITISNEAHGLSFDVQKFSITGVFPFSGHLEVPAMFQKPETSDFIINPWGIAIQLTDKFEPKHPEFILKV